MKGLSLRWKETIARFIQNLEFNVVKVVRPIGEPHDQADDLIAICVRLDKVTEFGLTDTEFVAH